MRIENKNSTEIQCKCQTDAQAAPQTEVAMKRSFVHSFSERFEVINFCCSFAALDCAQRAAAQVARSSSKNSPNFEITMIPNYNRSAGHS